MSIYICFCTTLESTSVLTELSKHSDQCTRRWIAGRAWPRGMWGAAHRTLRGPCLRRLTTLTVNTVVLTDAPRRRKQRKRRGGHTSVTWRSDRSFAAGKARSSTRVWSWFVREGFGKELERPLWLLTLYLHLRPEDLRSTYVVAPTSQAALPQYKGSSSLGMPTFS